MTSSSRVDLDALDDLVFRWSSCRGVLRLVLAELRVTRAVALYAVCPNCRSREPRWLYDEHLQTDIECDNPIHEALADYDRLTK